MFVRVSYGYLVHSYIVKTIILSIRFDWADFPMRLVFGVFSTDQWVPCTVHGTHKLSNSANFSSKPGPILCIITLSKLLY